MQNTIYVRSRTSPQFTFTNASIIDLSLQVNNTMTGSELAIDELSPIVWQKLKFTWTMLRDSNHKKLKTSDNKYLIFTYDDRRTVEEITFGTPLYYYQDGTLVGKYYFVKAKRISRDQFSIEAVSAVGMLAREIFYGGLYDGQTFQTVASQIIGANWTFSCASSISGIPIFGWIPVGSRRDALHQLLFATGVVLMKDANGEMYFTSPSNTTTVVPDSRIYIGGTIEMADQVSKVELTEHEWIQTSNGKTVTLYDNVSSGETANGALITFSQPCYGLSVGETSLTIDSYGVNYAIVSGTGTLTGTQYTHTMKVVSEQLATTDDDNTVSCTDAYLVNMANSSTVLDRLVSYYSAAKKVSMDIVMSGEKCGDRISFTDPFGAADSGFISSMNITASSFAKGSCEIVSGFEPPEPGNTYNHYVLLTGSGTWTVPSGVNRIKVVMIQGGQGGHGGYTGGTSSYVEDRWWEERWVWTGENGGDGGEGGGPGSAGKVYTIDIASNLQASYQYSCGTGGAGGATDAEGAYGTETTFGTYSSASGAVRVDGYKNIFTGDVYATTNISGFTGSQGANYRYHQVGYDFTLGEQTWTGGGFGTDLQSQAYGGNGGGAAYGANGNNGGDGFLDPIGSQEARYHGGNGGRGATAVSFTIESTYGQGGAGGSGGGGGGCPGVCDHELGYWYYPGDAGQGGNGAPGTSGGDGLCIVYY